MNDTDIKDLFDRIDVGDEPPMRSSADELARLSRKRLMRKRVAASITGGLGVASIAAATALLLPHGADPNQDAAVAASGSEGDPASSDAAPAGESAAGESANAPDPDRTEEPGGEWTDPFANTTAALVAAATTHLGVEEDEVMLYVGVDPATHQALPWSIGRHEVDDDIDSERERWSSSFAAAMTVTAAGYADGADDAVDTFLEMSGCDVDGGTCVQQDILGSDLPGWVADNGDGELVVIVQRPDGSLASAATLEGGADRVTLEQLSALVTDPSVVADPDEVAAAAADAEDAGDAEDADADADAQTE